MSAVERVRESQRLLERMAGVPEEVVAELDPAEQEKLVTELRVLAEQAARVRKGAELVALASAVRRLVIRTPALARRFSVTRRRTATQEDLDAIFSEGQAQEQAAQIYNSVARLDQEIVQELRKLPKQRSDDARL